MNPSLRFLILYFLFAGGFSLSALTSRPVNTPVATFIENKGQVHDQFNRLRGDILYSGFDGQLSYHFKKNGVSYQQYRVDSWKTVVHPKTKEKIKIAGQTTIYRSDLTWLNCEESIDLSAGIKSEGISNFRLDAQGNFTSANEYQEIIYSQLYKGISVKWYHRDGHLKYDYLLEAGADYKQIRLQVSGLSKLSVNARGELVMQTPLGHIIEQAPYVTQAGKKLPARWKVNGQEISFEIAFVNPNLPMVIDPAVRQWGTYYGGTGFEDAVAIAVDASGNIYMTGRTSSSGGTTIATSGMHQSTFGGSDDAYLVKFNSSGTRLWATYFGGSGFDYTYSCQIDNSGNVYLAGRTSSSGTVMTTAGAHQTVIGGNYDAFLSRFSSAGILQWSTLYGGTNDDYASDCAIDGSGNVYICGTTSSGTGTVMATTGSHQDVFGGGYDVFLAKFNNSGTRLWATYYGGTGQEFSEGCDIDNSGNVFITGYTDTYSGTVIATPGAHQTGYGGGTEGFVAQFNSAGVRQWGTYYGGNGVDVPRLCAVDGSGNVYIGGSTTSSTGISTLGSHQSSIDAFSADAFLAKFNNSGIRQWATYYGSAGSEEFLSCFADGSNIFVAGLTGSPVSSLVVTHPAHQYAYGGGPYDALLLKFNSSGVRQWATYYGGNGEDKGNSVAVDGSGNVYLAGITISSSNIATPGAHQSTFGGGGNNDAFLVSFQECDISSLSATASSQTVCVNESVNFFGTATSSLSLTYDWSGPNGFSSSSQNPSISNIPLAGSGTYTFTINGGGGCIMSTTVNVYVEPPSTLSVNSGSICIGSSFTINPSGSDSYTVTGGSFVVSPLSNSSYTIVGSSANNCPASNTVVSTVSVVTVSSLSIAASSTAVCPGGTITLTGSGASTYTWSGGPSTASYAVSPTVNTTYSLTGTAANGCTAIAVESISVYPIPALSITPSSTVICSGKSATLTGSGASTYTWSGGPVSANYIVSPLTTSNYTLTGTSVNGCTANAAQSVSVNATPVLTITPSSTVICSGNSATLTGSGASTYTWSGGPATNSFVVSPVSNTNYTLTATAANSCTNNAVQSLSVNASPVLSISPSHTVICSGKSATLTGSGASTYTWSGGPSTSIFTVNPVANTQYTLSGTAVNGCTDTAVQSLSVNTTPVLTITASNTLICSGKSATLVGSGVSTYTWISGPSNAVYVVNPLITSTYTLLGTAVNTCTNSLVQSVSVNASPVLTINPSSTVICTGKTATLTGSGANSYTWSGGPTAASYTVNPLSNSTYTLRGTALNSCTAEAVQSLSVNTTPVVSITPSSTLICSGQTATLTGSGASTYTWISGPANVNYEVSPVVNTSYTVIGTALNTCTANAVQSLSVNTTPVITISPNTSVICSGNSALFTGSGANTYTWIGGPNTNTFQVNPMLTTQYTLTGTALNNCTNTAVQTLSVNATPTLSIVPGNTLFCLGEQLTLTANGASTYTWSGGPVSSSYTVSPLINTNYTVTGTAPGNCTNTTNYSVAVNTPPTVTIAPSTTVICSGKTSTLTAGGAITYTWSAGPATTVYVVSPMTSSAFTVTGTAANGCTNSAAQSISVNPSPNLTITPSNSLVCSWTTATLTGSGANTYTWSGGPTSSVYTISPFSSVDYTLTGTALNGCTNNVVQSISVTPSPTLIITPSSSVICSGNSATLTGSGALTYTWTGGPVNSTYLVSPATTTNYILFGTAANSCTGSVVKTISVNATPGLTILPSSTVICQGSIATLTAQGAASFTWSGGGPSVSVNTVSPVSNTTYTVIGETNSCTNSAVQSISVNVSPTLAIVPNNPVICSGNSLQLNASGATTYTWEGGPSTSSFVVSPMVTTSYTLNGTTAAGGNCSTSAVVTVTVNTTPNLSVNSGSICSGTNFVILPSGVSTFTVSGGSATVSPLSSTNYTVTGTSAEGCPAANLAISQVTVYTTPTITVNSGTLCTGNAFTIQPGGSDTYTVSGGLYVVSPITNTSYSITGTSSMGCVASNTAISQVSVYITPTVSAGSGSICSGESFTINASGASNYTYSAGSAVVNPTTNATYSIVGVSNEGCVSGNTAIVSVSVQPSPSITVNSGNLCLGETFTLVPSGALTYTFSGGSATVTPVTTDTFSVIGTNSAGCISPVAAISTVVVIPIPTVVVNSGSVCPGESFTLQASGASSYSWNTGSTSSSLVVTPSASIVYTVIGLAGNSCTNAAISSLTVPAAVNPSILPSSIFFCYGNTLTLTATGAPNYTWNTSSQSSSIVVSPSVHTTYSLIASSGPGGCSNTAIYVVTVNPTPTVSISGNSLSCAGYQTTLTANGALSYTWNTGAMTSILVVNPTVTTQYNVVGVNFQGCTDTAYYQLNTTSLTTPSLCLVTVDSISQYNEIYWDKTLFPAADTFIVYRESSASVYTEIARVPKNAFSAYVDTNRSIGPITGDPNISLHRYKLQYVDSCGNLSSLSPYHESVKITDNLNGNFNWNYYAIEGVGPLQSLNYVLTRQNIITGVTFTVGVAAGNQLSDPQYAALSTTGNMKWYVYADGFSCNPSLKISETAAVKSRTKSNSTNERQFPTAIDHAIELGSKLIVYPNPTNQKLFVQCAEELKNANIQIMDLAGRILFEAPMNGSRYEINTADISNGVYFLKIVLAKKTASTHRVIIQH